MRRGGGRLRRSRTWSLRRVSFTKRFSVHLPELHEWEVERGRTRQREDRKVSRKVFRTHVHRKVKAPSHVSHQTVEWTPLNWEVQRGIGRPQGPSRVSVSGVESRLGVGTQVPWCVEDASTSTSEITLTTESPNCYVLDTSTGTVVTSDKELVHKNTNDSLES